MSGAGRCQGRGDPVNATHRGSDRVVYWSSHEGWRGGFSDIFCDRSSISPHNLLDVWQHRVLTGVANPYTDVIAGACTF